MKILVTGGCGFIGSHFVRHLLTRRPRARIVNLDKLTYAGLGRNLKGLPRDQKRRYQLVRGDIVDRRKVLSLMKKHRFDAVVNFAAETHVDRSIVDATPFLKTNVIGTQVLLECARQTGIKKFLQISTDEVYGTLGKRGKFSEVDPLRPNSPYSASKAAADLCCRAAHETFGQWVMVTRCSNNYGPYQFPEKLIPLMVTHALQDKPLPVYGDGKYVRDWIYAEDHAAALLRVVERGKPGEIYNIGGGEERQNLQIVRGILRMLGKPDSLIRHVRDRLGHDRRYAIDSRKIRRELGWKPAHCFEDGIEETVAWYCVNRGWWRRLIKLREHSKFQKRYYR